MLRIGLVIPVVKCHLKYLSRCLAGIEKQTYKPVIVVIAFSEILEFSEVSEYQLKESKYSFPILRILDPRSNTTGFNRNQGGKLLDLGKVDIISFFDCDDEMFPNRLEIIEKAFRIEKCDSVLHNLLVYNKTGDNKEPIYTEYESFQDVFIAKEGESNLQLIPNEKDKTMGYANGWISVSSKVWAAEKYLAGEDYRLREDCEYARRLFVKGYKTIYLKTQLGIYYKYHDKTRIAYLIITSEEQINKRIQYQKETFLKSVNSEDIYLISNKSRVEPRVYGWDTPENQHSLKLIHFLRNVVLDYDYYILIEDDTFIFTERLEKFLTNYSPYCYLWIGTIVNLYSDKYMSGGAGSILTKDLYQILVKLIRLNDPNVSNHHYCFDVCMGIFMRIIDKAFPCEYLDLDLFHKDKHKDESELTTALSFRGLRELEEFQFYDNLIRS